MGKETNSRRSLLRTINDELLRLRAELEQTPAQSPHVQPPLMSPEYIEYINFLRGDQLRDQTDMITGEQLRRDDGLQSEAYKYFVEEQRKAAKMRAEKEKELRRRAGLPPKRG